MPVLHARPALQKFRYDTINGEDKHAGDQAALRCAQNGPVLQLHCRRYTRGSVDVRIPRTRSRLLTAPLLCRKCQMWTAIMLPKRAISD